jgi:hypothetical protein
MKNLTPYEEHSLNENADSGPMGFVISVNASGRDVDFHYTIAGVYDTFYEFAQAVNEDIGFGGYDEEDDETEFKDLPDLMDVIMNNMDGVEEFEYDFWHGFKIKPGAKGYNSKSNSNCYKVAQMLEKLFVNPKEIMLADKGTINNENDLTYLARSIEKDPDKLSMYDDDETMYTGIIKSLNWDKKKLDALMRVNRIKNQL